MPEDGQPRHGDKADLIIAVVIRMATAFVDGTVNPAALGHVGVEQIVPLHPEIDLLQEAPQVQGLAK